MNLIYPEMALAVVLILALLLILSVRPCGKRENWLETFGQSYIAHRGFHNNGTDSPENTLLAFKKAVERGFGIEMDVQLTKDKVPVVFHDFDLKRVAGVDKRVDECTYEELQSYRVCDSSQKVPTFEEVLRSVDGAVPLIIELKAMWKHRELCSLVADLLDQYKGKFCIESFSPLAVLWFRRNRPEVIRGQLSTNHRKEGYKYSFHLESLLSCCVTNIFCKPDFVAYNLLFTNSFAMRLLRRFYKGDLAAWTVRSQQELDHAKENFKVFIFESFVPKDEDTSCSA